MEVKKIKNILTAIGNPNLNNELKKIKNLFVVNNDIQYQEGIFEILEKNKKIDFIILSQLIPGNLKIDELIEEIKNINSEIKIIIILENYDEILEKVLKQKGVYRIFYDNKIEIKNIIKIINEDEKMEQYNEEIRREIEELKAYIINEKKHEKNFLIKNKKMEENNINNLNNKKINNRINNKKNNSINNKIIKEINNKNKCKYIARKIKKIILNKVKNNKILNKYLVKKIENKYFIKKIIKNENIISKDKNIISILGNNGSGKSVFSIMFANSLKQNLNKILIIDFDIFNNSLHTILGVKKYSEKIQKIMENNNIKNNEINIENLIININKKIDLISGINLIFNSTNKITKENMQLIIEKLSSYYDVIIIDTTSECFFEYTKEIIKISDSCIFLTEANLLELSKSRRLLEIYKNNWNIENNKINILFNKVNKNSIDKNLLKELYSDYNILGNIILNNNFNFFINKNFKNLKIEKNTYKKYQTIAEKIS